jgi:hypothetical protein
VIDYTLVRFPIGGALDTKTDPAALSAPGLSRAENCWMDRSGALSKRFGYVSLDATLDVTGAAMPSLDALAPFSDTFIAFSDDAAYMYITAANRYTPIGSGVSATLDIVDVSAMSSADSRTVDHATVGNYTLYAVGEEGQTVRWVIRDNSSDSLVATEDISSAADPRVVSRGNVVYLLYSSTAATNLIVRMFDMTSATTLAASFSASPVTVATNIDSNQPIEAVSNSTYGVFVVYRSTTANTVAFGFVNTSGALTFASTIGTTSAPTCISAAVAPNLATHGIVYARNTQPNDIYAVLLSFNGATWSTLSTSGNIDSAMVTATASTACAFDSNTSLTIWYCDTPAGLNTHQGSYTTGGVATGRAFTLNRTRLCAKPFRYNSTWYAPVYVSSGSLELQTSIYVMSVDGVALSGHPISGTPIAVISDNATMFLSAAGNYLGQTTSEGSGVFRFGFLPRLTPGNVATSLSDLRRSVAAAAVLDLESPERHKTVRLGETMYIGGALLMQYDGGPSGIVENGFLRLVDPADITVTKGGSGSLTASSQYNYHVIPESLDSHGVREQGTNFGPLVVNLGVGEDEVTLAIPTIAATLKNIVFAVYRTESNGTVYYRVGSVANNPLGTTVSFNDTLADSDIVENESFPYADGALLDNTPPPAGHIIGVSSGRLFVASPTTRGLIYASKTREPGLPVEFNDALTIQVPEDTGEVTALSSLMGALVVFTERSIYRVAGEGPSNTGEGQFLTPERLSVDTGCTNQLSVVETPMGLMFRGTKGMYLLDQSFQLQYVGAPLENPDGDPIGEDAVGVLCPDTQQVRYSDGDRCHVYDYFHRQWYEWTSLWSAPTVVVGGRQHIVDGGVVLRESRSVYADGGVAYPMIVRLAPFKNPTGINGDIRVRRVGVVGMAQGAFTLNVLTHHNFETATIQTLTASISANAEFFEDWRVNTKILRGLSLTISDGGASNAGMRLQEVAVEIGQRQAGKLLGR